MKKRMSAWILTLALALSLAAPASAYDMGKAGENNTVSAGKWYTAAVDANGSLWMWGRNYGGYLGNGSEENSLVPVKALDSVATVSCGDGYTAVIKTDGSLWMWGDNGTGALGNGTTTGSRTPVKVMDNVAAVSCGGGHTAAIKTDGSLWMWGSNLAGELGNDGKGNARTRGFAINGIPVSGYPIQTVPVKVMDNVAAVSCGDYYTAAIKTDGSLWTWGGNSSGQLGNGTQEDSLIPVKVMDNVAAVSCGNRHTGAVKTDGSLWTWGLNWHGQLGNGGTGNAKDSDGHPIQTVPVKVLDNVAAVSCGWYNHTGAVKTDGSLWMCGGNWSGLLGNGDTEDYVVSVPVKVLDNVAAVSCGYNHTIAVKTDDSLWTWGSNVYGQLGNGDDGGGYVNPFQTLPGQIAELTASAPAQPPAAPAVPVTNTAYASTQNVLVDGRAVEFQCYALRDANGNDTNYIKLRDIAFVLNGTAAQFGVGWNGGVNIITGESYLESGSEMRTPFSGDRTCTVPTTQTKVNGVVASLDAIVLTDDAGNGYTYYKLRDLGEAIGFTVDWSADKGIFIETT